MVLHIVTDATELTIEELNSINKQINTGLDNAPSDLLLDLSASKKVKLRPTIPAGNAFGIIVHRNRRKTYLHIAPEAYTILATANLISHFRDITVITDKHEWEGILQQYNIKTA